MVVAGDTGSEVAKTCQAAMKHLRGAGFQRVLLQTAVDNLRPLLASLQQLQTGRCSGVRWVPTGPA